MGMLLYVLGWNICAHAAQIKLGWSHCVKLNKLFELKNKSFSVEASIIDISSKFRSYQSVRQFAFWPSPKTRLNVVLVIYKFYQHLPDISDTGCNIGHICSREMDPVFLVRNSFGCGGSTNQKPVTDADGYWWLTCRGERGQRERGCGWIGP